MSKILLTNDIKEDKTSGLKARVDVLNILKSDGYTLLQFPRLSSLKVMRDFWKVLSDTVKKGDHIVVEYPCWLRRRLLFVKAFTLVKKIPFYGIVHDINTIRFQTSPKRDIIALKLFDAVVSHNYAMTSWLKTNGYQKKIVNLDLFDYCLGSENPYAGGKPEKTYKLFYAGNLSYAKAAYIYNPRMAEYKNFSLDVYGQYLEQEKLGNSGVVYKGTFNPDTPVLNSTYQFGLVWEGTSIDTCDGDYGHYIRFNNPHKFSLYISLGLPVITWKDAAVARFVTEHNIGFVAESFEQINNILSGITPAQYREYADNVLKFSQEVRIGNFLKRAMRNIIKP